MALGHRSAATQDERLSRIAKHVPVGLFETDDDGALTFVSGRWFDITGIEPESARGFEWMHAVMEAEREDFRIRWQSAVAARAASDLKCHARTTSGDVRRLRFLFAPAEATGEIPRGCVGVVTDVTHLESESLQYRTIAEAMPNLVWVADPRGNITYFNKQWVEYTGITVDDLPLTRSPDRHGANPSKEPVRHVVHPEDLPATVDRWQRALQTSEPYELEYRLRNVHDGTYRWFVARAMPVRAEDGSISHWIGAATDIDTQRHANDNLRFIIDASSAFSNLYDVDQIAQKLAQIAIDSVADWCFVVLRTADGTYDVPAIAHRDKSRVKWLEQYRNRYPVRPNTPTDIVARKGISILTPSITDDDLRAGAEDEQHFEILRELRMRSAMSIALTADSGITYGAVVTISSESARQFTSEDLEVAERVAKRAATAIETAQEFQLERKRTQRLRFIARASELVFESLDLQSSFDKLCDFLVNEMADLAFIMRFERDGALRTVAASHRDPNKRPIAERLCGQRTLKPKAEELAARVLAQHETMLQREFTTDEVLPNMWEYLANDVRSLGVHSAITVPLFARGETLGALVVYWCDTKHEYTEDDVPIFEDLGRRLSVAIENFTAFERERRIAAELQQALLPTAAMLPHEADLTFDAEYRPSLTEAEVGGDWFDAFARSDGSLVVCVGDVVGRGLAAAGLMGKLRQAIGVAAIYETQPASILNAVDEYVRSRRHEALATAFLGIIDKDRKVMRYATAGHPPPLLRRKGSIEELRGDGLPIGLRDFAPGQNHEVSLEDAQVLVLYTDGLVEATRDTAFGERRLMEVVGSQALLYVASPARMLCDACLPRDAQDDTAVLAVRFGERAYWHFDAENAQAAGEARREFVEKLHDTGLFGETFESAELIFGELVGNVVRHAPGPIDVQLDFEGSSPVLHVVDRGRGFVRDPALPVNPLSESGRGMYIISRLASNVRVERIPGFGNHVAATLKA